VAGSPVRIDEVDWNGPVLDVHMQRAARGEIGDYRGGVAVAGSVGGDALIPWAVGGKGPPDWRGVRADADGNHAEEQGAEAGGGHGMEVNHAKRVFASDGWRLAGVTATSQVLVPRSAEEGSWGVPGSPG